MKIDEAAKQASKENKLIARKKCIFNTEHYKVGAILPTNSYDCCQLIKIEKDKDGFKFGKSRVRWWNPTLDDLTADDWIVIDDDYGINLNIKSATERK